MAKYCGIFKSQLRALADIAEVVMPVADRDGEGGEAVSAEAKLKVIRMLAEYTHSVCLLLRFGLLPQASDHAYRLRASRYALSYFFSIVHLPTHHNLN